MPQDNSVPKYKNLGPDVPSSSKFLYFRTDGAVNTNFYILGWMLIF